MQAKITSYLLSLSTKAKALLGLLIVATAVAGYFSYNYYTAAQQLDKIRNNPQLAVTQEVNDTIAKVGKIVALPTGETPTVATITDKSKLTDQPFFAKAQNGDKVLIYVQAKKAYLYRPTTNKLIDVAPINVGTSPSPSPTASPKK